MSFGTFGKWAATLAAAVMLTSAGGAAAFAQYPPPPPPTPTPTPKTTEPDGEPDVAVDLSCEVSGEGTVSCTASGFSDGLEVTFDLALPAGFEPFSLIPLALPASYQVIASGTRTANGDTDAVMRYPYPCAVVEYQMVVRATGVNVLGDSAVVEDTVSTTEDACVDVTLAELRNVVANGYPDDTPGAGPLARTGTKIAGLLAVALTAIGLGSTMARRRRGSTDPELSSIG